MKADVENVLDFAHGKVKRSNKILNYKKILESFSIQDLTLEVNHLINILKSKKSNDVYLYMSELTLKEIESRYKKINNTTSKEIQKIVKAASELVDSFSLKQNF